MRRTVPLLFCCLALVAACGGDGADEPASAPADASDWVAQVNAICDRNRAASEDVAAEVGAEGIAGRQAAAEVLERAQPVQERLLDELEGVEPPEELKADYERFLSRIGDAVALFPEIAATVRGEQSDPELTTKLVRIAAQTRPFASEHGLMACVPDAGR